MSTFFGTVIEIQTEQNHITQMIVLIWGILTMKKLKLSHLSYNLYKNCQDVLNKCGYEHRLQHNHPNITDELKNKPKFNRKRKNNLF